jgi:inosine-uridine nucleoside N-ribohydrolase
LEAGGLAGFSGKKVPVILDTDIGGDIDDTWALAMMLKSPELDVKLIATDTGNTTYRAKIVAKMLETAGRTDIPVGIGIHFGDRVDRQYPWVEKYDLSTYPGIIQQDGVKAIIDAVMDSPGPITLLCIGPVPNIAAALERDPRIAEKARFVGMHGCLRKSPPKYGDGGGGVVAEYNVRAYPKACQKAFTAAWDMTITPLDTCGFVKLEGEKYRAVRDCEDPVAQALMENYGIWLKSWHKRWKEEFESRSSILFDTVAAYLCFSEELLVMENLGVRVTDDGFTIIDDNAKAVNCATEWKDLPAFESLLVERLTGIRI